MDTTALAPMTELEAINDMLSLISESPVASLDEASRVADAQIAMQILRRESRDVQTRGWDWNTDENLMLSPDIDGNIILPRNTVSVDPMDPQLDFVSRGGKLWDRTNKTFKIGRKVAVKLVALYSFEDLPETARRYISLAAGRKFENRTIGDGNSHQINELDVLKAWAILLQEECDNSESSVLQSTTVRRIVHGRFR
jgi:hypothetical protein